MSLSTVLEDRKGFHFQSPMGKYYFDLREKSFHQSLTKSYALKTAILSTQEIIEKKRIPTIIDFGCFDGHVLGEIQKNTSGTSKLIGLDFNTSIIDIAKKSYPSIEFYTQDILQPLPGYLKQSADIALCINTLHEIYSIYGLNDAKQKFDPAKGKKFVKKAINTIIHSLKPHGSFILFDGVAPSVSRRKNVKVTFPSKEKKQLFLDFVDEYQKFMPYTKVLDALVCETNIATVAAYITKHQFVHTPVWPIEQEECYQYYTKEEFEDAIKSLGCKVISIEKLSPKSNEWQQYIQILDVDPSVFSIHIMVVAQKTGK